MDGDSLSAKMLQLNQQQQQQEQSKGNAAAAAVQALSFAMNQTSNQSSIALANALRLNNGDLNALAAKLGNATASQASSGSPSSTSSFKQTNGSMNLVNSSGLSISPLPGGGHQSPEVKRIMLKKSNNERKYPCGIEGCNWVFTRSNHVVRHQRRIHGLSIKSEPGMRRSSGSQVSSHHRSALGAFKSVGSGLQLGRGQLAPPNLQLMLNRKLLHLKGDEFPARLSGLPIKRTFSKNSLLNSNLMCNGNSNLPRPKLSNSLNHHRPGQPQLKVGNIRRFQCDVDDCGQKFSSELMFNNHLKLVHHVNRNLINKHSVNLNSSAGGLASQQQQQQQTQNTSLNNLNSLRNTIQNPGSQIINLLASQQQSAGTSPAKTAKNNMNTINNHIKLFLSNKTVNQNEGQDSFASYINNLNANLKLKLLQFKGNNTSVTVNNPAAGQNSVVQQPPQLNITKVSQPNAAAVNLPKVILPVTTLSPLGTLNLPTTTVANQQNKPLFITQIQLPSGGGQLITDKLLTNPAAAAAVIQQSTPPAKGHVIYQCEIKSCIQRFATKDHLVDHLFDEHNAFEPEVVIQLDSSDENWMLLEDPKRVTLDDPEIGQPLPKSSDSNQQDYRPCRIARSSNEPSLATTLGIVKEVVQRVDNVNTLHNIAATSSTTYSGLNKNHVCNISGCTKSFSKRYHLVRHRLEAHQVGKLSLMQDILNGKNAQEALELELLNVNASTTDRPAPPPKIKKKESTPAIPKILIKNISTAPGASSSQATPFYMRRPPADYRPYPCRYPKCGWSFKRAYHLKRHCRTHNHYFPDCPEEPPKGWKMPPEDEEEEDDALQILEDDNVVEIGSELSDDERDHEPVLRIAEDEDDEIICESEEVHEETKNEQHEEEVQCEEENEVEHEVEAEIEEPQIEQSNKEETEQPEIEVSETEVLATNVPAAEDSEIEEAEPEEAEDEEAADEEVEMEVLVENEQETEETEPVANEPEAKHEAESEAESVAEIELEDKSEDKIETKIEPETKIEEVQEVKEEPAVEKSSKETGKLTCKMVQPIVRKVTRSASIELQQLQIKKEREPELVEDEKAKPVSKPATKVEAKVEAKVETKTESKAPESSRIQLRRAPDTRRSTRQGLLKQEQIIDEDQSNSSEVSSSNSAVDPQLIRCEFSQCKLTFRRKRQYDLHVKTHLAEKSTKRPKIESDERATPSNHRASTGHDSSANESSTVNSNDENSSEERYSIAEQSVAPRETLGLRTRRTSRRDVNNNLSLELDVKSESSQRQLLLLCNAKDMIFYQNELKTRGKGWY